MTTTSQSTTMKTTDETTAQPSSPGAPGAPGGPGAPATPKDRTLRKGKARRTKLLAAGMEVDRVPAQSRRQAAVVLEVLAGVRTPEEAAEALGISVPTFYNLETRALRGLVHGCTPEPPGRKLALQKQLRLLEAEKHALQQQLQRHRALLRNTQRAGDMLTETTAAKRKATNKPPSRKRKPRVRALRAIEALERGT